MPPSKFRAIAKSGGDLTIVHELAGYKHDLMYIDPDFAEDADARVKGRVFLRCPPHVPLLVASSSIDDFFLPPTSGRGRHRTKKDTTVQGQDTLHDS